MLNGKIELYNHTRYPDEPLQEALEWVYDQVDKIWGLEGDIAVKARYTPITRGTVPKTVAVAQAHPWMPTRKELVGRFTKKLAHKGYGVAATPQDAYGWFWFSIPKFAWDSDRAELVLEWMIHETLHIWQYRNMQLTREFLGFSNPWSRRRTAHAKQPIEVFTNQQVAKFYKNIDGFRRSELVENLKDMIRGYRRIARPVPDEHDPVWPKRWDMIAASRDNTKPKDIVHLTWT